MITKMIPKLLYTLFMALMLLFPSLANAPNAYWRYDIDGTDSLDMVTGMADGEPAYISHISGTSTYDLRYTYDADSTATESLPFVVDPTAVGDGRWILNASCYKEVAFSVEDPTSSENIGSARFDKAAKVYKVVGVVIGTSPSVTIQPQHGTNRASGTNLFSSAQAITSTGIGNVFTTGFNDATIAANAFLWLTTTAQSGTITNLEVQIIFVYYWGS